MKQAFDFVLTEQVDREEDQNEIESYQQNTNFTSAASSTTSTITSQIDRPSISTSPNFQTEEASSATTPRHHTESSTNTTHQSWQENGSKFYQNTVSEFPASVIVEPTEMQRYLQCNIVYGPIVYGPMMNLYLKERPMNELPGIGSPFIRKGFWDRQGANIASRYKKMYGGNLFRRPKNDLRER